MAELNRTTTPVLSPRRRKFIALLIGALGLLGLTVFDVLDWLGGAGPWVICAAVIVLFEWEHVAPWLRNPVGGDDYLVKPFDPDELLARVRRLLPAPLADGRTVRKLTRRELDVISLLVEGLSQPEIAEKLFISPKTVGKHIEHILAKLGVHSRAQAVARAVRDELIESHRRAWPDVTASAVVRE